MKKLNQKIITRNGTYPYVRVDDAFLCKCGCGRRVTGNHKFFSNECYGKYVRENKIVRRKPESYKKGVKNSKEMKRLLEGIVL